MYLGIIIFLLNSFLGFLTIYKRKTLESVVFGIFASSFGLWALSIYVTLATSSLLWGRTAFFAAILGIGSLFLFSFIFPGNKKISLLKLLIILAPPVFFCAATCTNLMLKDVAIVANSIIGTYGPVMMMYQLFAPIYIFGSIYIIYKKYRKATYQDRNKIGYVFLGVTLFVGPAVLTNAVLPLWFGINSLNGTGPIFSIFMVVSITYAIIRHRFLDIKIVIQRGLVYSFLITCVTTTYEALVFTFEHLLKGSSQSTFIGALATTLIGIFGVPILKDYFQKITDPIFFKGTYDYATVLSKLTDELNKNISLDSIIEKTTAILMSSLRIENVTFKLHEIAKDEDLQGSIAIPIISNDKKIGKLLVGKKLSGDNYSPMDMNLLETFTKQAGIALEKAFLYKQVEDYARTLEEKVKERTQEVVAIQKEQETMMLEISHGLQTPLTIMKGELFLMRKQGHDTKRVDTIDASIDRISSFIYRFLSLTKLESAAVIPMSRLNLSSLLTQIILFFEQEAHEKGITLSGTIPPDIFVTGIKEELEELFSNLISNSIKYMRKDGPQGISITLSTDTKNTIVTLRDDGIGMKEENLPNLFKKFYRIKEAETKGIQGTGLGLVICKKIIDKHDGTLDVTSVFGEGSTFTITLPLLQK